MAHKCEYCDKEVTPGSKIEGITCKCDIAPESCELPEKIVCSGALCQFKFQVDYYETKLEELKAQHADGIEKLKELNNHYRIMGITPAGLESLIQNHGVNIPGLFVNKNEKFTWDQMSPDNLVTIGLKFMQVYETVAKQWAQFLNEKSVKVNIKKELIAQTDANLKKAQKIRNKEIKANGTVVKLTPFEKLVLDRMKTFNWDQKTAEDSLKVMGMTGSARELKVKP